MSRVWDESLNPYEILNLHNAPDCTEADIKKAYRQLAKLKHPDKNPNANIEEFHLLQNAYEILCDAEARSAYDQVLRARSLHEARLSRQSEKRRRMREDLEAKERATVKAEEAEIKAQRKLHAELERLRARLEREDRSRRHSGVSRDQPNIVRAKWNLAKKERAPSESEIQAEFERWVRVKSLVLRVKKRCCTAIVELFDSSEVTRLLGLQHAAIEGELEDGWSDLVKYKLTTLESNHSVIPRNIAEESGTKESTKLTFEISEVEVLEKLRSFGKTKY